MPMTYSAQSELPSFGEPWSHCAISWPGGSPRKSGPWTMSIAQYHGGDDYVPPSLDHVLTPEPGDDSWRTYHERMLEAFELIDDGYRYADGDPPTLRNGDRSHSLGPDIAWIAEEASECAEERR